MRQNLLETYSRQLKVAEAYVAKNFDGRQVSANTALATAVLLDNTNRWMTEALDATVPTNRGDMGDWKKFCLNLTNIAVPSLIANDLVIVHPMTSYSGSVAYLEYVTKTEKPGIPVNTVLNSAFGLGQMTPARQNYASQVVIETAGAEGALSFTAVPGGMTYTEKDANGKLNIKTATYKVDGVYTDTAPSAGSKVAYVASDLQMTQVPATDIPTIGPKMKHIPLVAEPRRIAVRYDQITAFQA